MVDDEKTRAYYKAIAMKYLDEVERLDDELEKANELIKELKERIAELEADDG